MLMILFWRASLRHVSKNSLKASQKVLTSRIWENSITSWVSGKIWIGQSAYTAEVLKIFQMENSKPTATPIDTGAKLAKVTEDSKLFNQELYQPAIGSLLYLSSRTRSDIAYAVSNVARFSSKPTLEVH